MTEQITIDQNSINILTHLPNIFAQFKLQQLGMPAHVK